MMDEQTLVARAQEGDLQAFNELILAYQQLAYAVAHRILANEQAAMDATQDAFLRGYRALCQFRGGSFKAWILRITTNCCYDQLRAPRHRSAVGLDDLAEDGECSRILEDPGESPQAHADRRELDRVIQTGLNLLPDNQRITVVLSDIEGMSLKEIAAVTSVPLGTVKSRLSRGRARLAEFFQEQDRAGAHPRPDVICMAKADVM